MQETSICYQSHHCLEVELIVEGIKGVEYTENTMLYEVSLADKTGTVHTYQCYGLDKISSTAPPPDKRSYKEMCKKFGITPQEVQKPKEIDFNAEESSSS